MTDLFDGVTTELWCLLILGSATVFTVAWTLDAVTHKELAHKEITRLELDTHRRILLASFVMELSLVSAYWLGAAALPLFIGAFITRLVHEFIDELKFHTDRCTFYESMLHLVMWISVITKTAAMFCWGFLLEYQGVTDVPVIFIIWAGLLLVVMSYVSYKEWYR
ncbi:MAG: hypothetical protein IPM77_14375 [Crocinitomicaceae bacterium]|nr:hypothetical protein [Crocinitomicaceae bacterium]